MIYYAYILSNCVISMHIDDNKYISNGKPYRRVLIRQSYREGKKVKSRTIANISHLAEHEIQAIKLAFKYKDDLSFLEKFADQKLCYDKIAGPCLLLHQVAQRLGITKILGKGPQAGLALWLVFTRLIGQGSRLSAVRLAGHHYGCELLGIDQLNENLLYGALDWLHDNRHTIEKGIYRQWKGQHPGTEADIFLYDVSSSYLEGDRNELAAYGYNRDKKKGKKQIVYGLLTDREGSPLAVEAFNGNTADPSTFQSQIEKIKQLYGCRHVTVVGDKGMLKSIPLENLGKENYRYITSISKPQIEGMLKKGVFQLELFADELCEIEDTGQGIRYILRRNPARAEEIGRNRKSMIKAVEAKISGANEYLAEHARAKPQVQEKHIRAYIAKLRLTKAMEVGTEKGRLEMTVDEGALEEMARLDGCYVIKTDVEKAALDKEKIHSQYKALSMVEWAFRIEKSCLEIRPVYLRKGGRTRGHLMVCLLAYMIERHLREKWAGLNTTVAEGLASLGKIAAVGSDIGETKILRILQPDPASKQLLECAGVKLPNVILKKTLDVVTYKNLQSERK
jgi:transposase